METQAGWGCRAPFSVIAPNCLDLWTSPTEHLAPHAYVCEPTFGQLFKRGSFATFQMSNLRNLTFCGLCGLDVPFRWGAHGDVWSFQRCCVLLTPCGTCAKLLLFRIRSENSFRGFQLPFLRRKKKGSLNRYKRLLLCSHQIAWDI